MKSEQEISNHADKLRSLGFPEAAIQEAINSMKKACLIESLPLILLIVLWLSVGKF